MNPICSWNRPSLQQKEQQCSQNIALYTTLKKVFHIGLVLLALTSLTSFGYLNPSYFHISSTLLFVAYYPSMQVTVETLERWITEVNEERDKYRAIIRELNHSNSVFQAQINALKDLPFSSIDTKKIECDKSPSSEKLRLELLDLKREQARINILNMRRHIEIAYIRYIEKNQTDRRSLSDFGHFKTWPIDCLLNDQPFTVFISATGRAFTNCDEFSEIFT